MKLILPFVLFVILFQTVLSDVLAQIYERSVGRVQGLARLLAIEKLATPEARSQYQYRRSMLRGRPAVTRPSYVRAGHRFNGDLKADVVFSGLEMSDYDIVNLHIPYGPGWDARRIERLIYKTVSLVVFQQYPPLLLCHRISGLIVGYLLPRSGPECSVIM